MNPPLREPREAPQASPQAADPPPPASVAVDEDDGSEVASREPVAPPLPEIDAEGLPMPVQVPYARSDSAAEAVVAPPARAAPRPSRSPFWAAVRSHVWLVAIILVVTGMAGTAYWGLRVHQRIPERTLERAIADREHASAVRCVEQQSNGAVWACGLVYRAASVCLIADVNPVGDWNTNDGAGLCDHRSQLTAILPDHITAGAVTADMETQFGISDARCAKVPGHKVRWACLGPPSGGNGCLLVRVAAWTSLATSPSDVCEHVPAFQKKG